MIVLEHLTKDFKAYKKYPGLKGAIKGLFTREYTIKKAVDDMTFEIGKGEIVGYIGSNGAGKSTTIKMMSGILVPTSGKCTVNGLVPYEQRQKNAKNIGVVFGQRTQLWWDLPLSETYAILKEIYDVPDELYKRQMEFFQEVLDINEFMSSTVRTLSLGQRMRADLAASLLHNPKVLYLDEPTIGLDVVVKDRIRKAIKDINNEFKTTIILTTHDLVDIEELCSRIIIIDEGKKLYDGSLKNIKDTYGYMKTINMSVKNMNVDFGLEQKFGKEDFSYEILDDSLKLIFNKNKFNTADIISHVMSVSETTDVDIQETNITEIIKKIYESGV